jgi:proteasome accessory factor B
MRKGKPARRYSQAGRVHDLVRFIEARHGVSVDEMVEESGVERRTIYRDLIAIQEAGYPLVSEWLNRGKVYRFLTRFKDVPPINFTLQEIMTLYFLRAPCDFLQGTPFQDEMESIFRKVNASLPPRYAAHIERIATVSIPLLQGKRDYSNLGEQLKLLREALLYQYRVKLAYRAKGKEKTSSYRVDPYSLIFYKGGLYLLGFAHNRQGMRTFAAERISCVEVEKERFEMPEDFRPEGQFRSAFGIVEEAVMPVRIKFSPAIAHTVRDRLWHPSQKTESMADGSIVLSFEAGGRMEIVSWILSYGEHAEVLAPAELREEVGKKIGEMAARYTCD